MFSPSKIFALSSVNLSEISWVSWKEAHERGLMCHSSLMIDAQYWSAVFGELGPLFE